ncbi:MAG: Eco57I restriction-modification methylase domain-containing protein, partial [Candidatus Hermodarchaeota archaeon]
NELENKRIIDLSCGCGSFLNQVIKVKIEYYLNKFNLKAISDLSIEQVKLIIKEIQENVYGLDINSLACILCCINLYFSLYELINIVIRNDPEYEIPSLKIHNINALEFSKFNNFDFVVGNPPYIFLRDIDQEEKNLIEYGNFDTISGQYDYYQIFIELGIKVLRNSGYLGYILPDSLLALSNRRVIRKYIYVNTKIKELYYIGQSFDDPVVSNVIVILQKENDEIERLENKILLKNRLDKNEKLIRSIPQMVLKKWDYNFLINLDDRDMHILDYLNSNFLNLKEINIKPDYNIKIFRGVELGKEGKVLFCKKCEKYIPMPTRNKICKDCNSILNFDNFERIIVDKVPRGLENQYKLFLFSMSRYQSKKYKYINIKKKGINYKNLEDYEDRIVIRQLSQNNMICATYDKYSLTSQSFYNLKILKSSLSEINHYYLLGLINSQLLSYYFIKMFGSYKKLFPRILIEKIETLPIALPENAEESLIGKEIQECVKRRLLLGNSNNDEAYNFEKNIDSLVFKLYKIRDKDKLYISKFFTN